MREGARTGALNTYTNLNRSAELDWADALYRGASEL